MSDLEKKIIDYCKKHYIIIFAFIITILAILVRWCFLKYVSYDFRGFIQHWYQYIKVNGHIKALATYEGDYNAPYLTIMSILTYLPFNPLYTIKAVSILFDFVLALSCGYLVYDLTKDKNKIAGLVTYSIILFLPQVLENTAMWAQCDSIYSSFIILSLIFLFKEKYPLSFIMLGCAFAFKLQFIFILPLYLILYVSKNKFSILNFLLIPITNVVLCLPAIIFGGMKFSKCFTVFGTQVGEYSKYLVLNYPNIYQLIESNVESFRPAGVLLTITLCFALLIYTIHKKVKWNNEKILTLGLLILIMVTYFLPGMHERYMFVGEILSVIYFLLYKKNLPLVIAINLNAFITYSLFLNKVVINLLQIQSIIYGVLILYFALYTMKFLADETVKKKDLC